MTQRVAIVNSAASVGGAELSLLPVARVLVERGARVQAFLPEHGPLEDELRSVGVESSTFRLGDGLREASRQYGVSGLARLGPAVVAQQLSMLRVLRRFRPDVVYANGFRAQLGATIAGRLLGAFVVWHVRDFVPETTIGRSWGVLGRRAQLVIANSRATATQPLLGRATVVDIPNGIDLAAFHLRAAEPAGTPLLGMVGHLTPWKGHRRFLRILSALRTKGTDVRGAIAGGARYDTASHETYGAELTAEIARLDLQAAVDIRDVSPREMPAWLTRLSVLVHCPDRPEPFGRALVEAMAAGVPVVAAAGPGAAEVVGPAGIVLPLGADDQIVHAVEELLRDEQRRNDLVERGRARAMERFDEGEYARRVADALLRP